MEKNDILVIYGDEIKNNTINLLKHLKLNLLIAKKDSAIVLKPNLVLPQDPCFGATTHNEIIVGLIEYLQDYGFFNIKIVESSWIGASTKQSFRKNGYLDISKKYNIDLIDVKDDEYYTIVENGIKVEISKEIMDCDFLINIPVLKGHCQTKMTCALKNMKGCLSDKSKRDFHTLGLMKPIAVLNKIKCADLIIVDSINGDLDFEEGGTPIKTDRLFVARDSVLCDSFSALLLGYKIEEIEYLKIAESLGVGITDVNNSNVIYLNKPTLNNSDKKPKGIVRELAKNIDSKNACSACYGNLIHAINKLQLNYNFSTSDKICIGQGYKGVCEKNLIGVGNCTSGFKHSLKGCPPSATDMIEFLKDIKK